MPRRRIVIDPVTRLDGAARIDIVVGDAGDVERAYLQVTGLRGFEAFAVGRPAEDMPQIASRISASAGIAHHLASAKALDALWRVDPPPAARMVRELVNTMAILEDHALRVCVLGALAGPGVPGKDGAAGRFLGVRGRIRAFIAGVAGRAGHPVFGLPGGVSRGVGREAVPGLKALAAELLDFSRQTLSALRDAVLKDAARMEALKAAPATVRTYCMGMVDGRNAVSFYDGKIRVVDPDGGENAKFPVNDYRNYIAERVEAWTYARFAYLRQVGWQGFTDGRESGIFAAGPLARLNAAEGMATPEAQKAYEEFFVALGPRPVHHVLASDLARAVEMIHAAERVGELANDPGIAGDDLRALPGGAPATGVGAVEAPGGTLIHHYETDEQGVVRKANIVSSIPANTAAGALAVERAARALVQKGAADDGILETIAAVARARGSSRA